MEIEHEVKDRHFADGTKIPDAWDDAYAAEFAACKKALRHAWINVFGTTKGLQDHSLSSICLSAIKLAGGMKMAASGRSGSLDLILASATSHIADD